MNIDITQLTSAQLKGITDQLKAMKDMSKCERVAWKAKVDSMLQETDDHGFMHTTADIWLELHLAKLEVMDPRETHDKESRDQVLKKIQARKQKLEKEGLKVGYLPTVKAIGEMSVDQLIGKLIMAQANGKLEKRHIETLITLTVK